MEVIFITLLEILEIIPNGRTYTLVSGDTTLLSRRMERKIVGKTRHILTSVAGTEEELFLARKGITLQHRVEKVIGNYDDIGKYSVTIHLYNGKD